VTTTLQIDDRFCGPPGSGNGGYSAGRLAAHLRPADGEAVEVTLRAPVPLGQDLIVRVEGDSASLLDNDRLVAAARLVPHSLDIPECIPFDVATRIVRDAPLRGFVDDHPFPGCFVCGPDREPGDGLRLFAARVPATPYFAVPWTVADAGVEFVWAALDCPSSFPMYLAEDPFDGPCVLGRLTAAVHRVPALAEPTVVMAWRESIDGRKLHTASVLFGEDGHLCASARATWIRVTPDP
jgi:hypothetical protein